jgi:hypothetical protein
MSPLMVPVGRGGAAGKALAVGAAQRTGGAEGVLDPKAAVILCEFDLMYLKSDSREYEQMIWSAEA